MYICSERALHASAHHTTRIELIGPALRSLRNHQSNEVVVRPDLVDSRDGDTSPPFRFGPIDSLRTGVMDHGGMDGVLENHVL